MPVSPKVKRHDLLYPELCYKIMGVLFDVSNVVGKGHKEHFYQKAISHGFKKAGIQFQEQPPVKTQYKGELIGIYYFDFLVENKVVLEIKVRNYFSKKDIEQLYSYLKAKRLQLGIIAHFTDAGVKFKRVVNIA